MVNHSYKIVFFSDSQIHDDLEKNLSFSYLLTQWANMIVLFYINL